MLQEPGDLGVAVGHNNEVLKPFVVYQPVYNSQQDIVGAETLTRTGNSIPPDVFFQSLEVEHLFNLTVEIIKRALTDLASFQKIHPSFKIGVNIPASVLTTQLLGIILTTLTQLKLKPNCLILELTEKDDINKQQQEVLDQCNKEGLLISIDDVSVQGRFGTADTGFSKLNLVKISETSVSKIINSIKISASEVAKLMKSAAGKKRLQKFVYGYTQKNINVIIEGIENFAEASYLFKEDLPRIYFQGYGLSLPVTSVELLNKLSTPIVPQHSLLPTASP